MPGRSSRMSRRMESTSNQYGPCVSSLASTQLGASSSAARMLPDADSVVVVPVAAEGAVSTAVVVAAPSAPEPPPPQAAMRPPRETVPPMESARLRLTRSLESRISSFM